MLSLHAKAPSWFPMLRRRDFLRRLWNDQLSADPQSRVPGIAFVNALGRRRMQLERRSSKQGALELSGLPPDAAFEIETLDQTHGSATRDWDDTGQPLRRCEGIPNMLRHAPCSSKTSVNVRYDTLLTKSQPRKVYPSSIPSRSTADWQDHRANELEFQAEQ